MKEITRIHLAKTPYNIEVEARKMLQHYLEAIEKNLQADGDTMTEIEARIVELLNEKGSLGEKVVTVAEVQQVQQKLGEPGDFIDEEEATAQADGPRRLMRDTTSGMLGGVLAGIAAFYRIDVLWLRLAAVVLGLISFGTAFVLYLVLWLIMPATKTVADRLQLFGQKVTPSEIKRHLDDFSRDSERTKPLVVVLRGLLGLFWLAGGLLALLILGVGFGATGSHIFEASVVPAASGWLMIAFIAMVASGILLVAFCLVAAYASFTWKMNKRLGLSLGLVAVAGLLAFSGAIASGFYSRQVAQQAVAQHTHHQTRHLSQLQNVQHVVINGSAADVSYVVRPGQPTMKIDTVGAAITTDSVQLTTDGQQATVSIAPLPTDCQQRWNVVCQRHVTLYGPSLTTLTAHDATTVNYSAQSQARLAVIVGAGADFRLEEGRLAQLNVQAQPAATIDVTGGSVGEMIAQTTHEVTMELGNVDQLAITNPTACPVNGATEVRAQSLQVLIHNGQRQDNPEYQSQCLAVTLHQATQF